MTAPFAQMPVAALAALAWSACTPQASVVKDDEVVTLFPAYARLVDGGWEASLHGWIYEPEEGSAPRGAAVALLRRALGVEETDLAAAVFSRRARWFLVDNERGKRLAVEVGGARPVLPPSGPDGHFSGPVRLPAGEPGVIPWSAAAADGRRFEGRLHQIPPEGASVISDIDDTVKVTVVTDRRRLVETTFLEEFEAVPGMAALYGRWAARGTAFHFVSSSPWQLYPELSTFLTAAGFPAATFHLKPFRVKDSTLFDLLKSGLETKPAQIIPILDAFPGRTFFLVGDSGEQDPEIYGALARQRPAQVRHVLIRNVTGEDRGSERLRKAFEGIPADRWTLFSDPAEVALDP